MRQGVSLLFFISIVLPVSAQQFSFERWHDGRVVLASGDTLKGTVMYNMMQDIVLYKGADGHEVLYTPKNVLSYEIFDDEVHRYRDFYSLPYPNQTGYKVPTFFELVSEGKLTVLCKESVEETASPYYYDNTMRRRFLVFHYFFLKDNGNLDEFSGRKEDLLDLMGNRAEDVNKYMRRENLQLQRRGDFEKIVAYYNSFFNS